MHDNEARFRSFVENSFDVIFILDDTGMFRFVSPSWEQHFGYPADDVIGKSFAPLVHPDDVQPCFDFLVQVMANGQPGTSPRYRVRCADGSWKLFVANGSRFTGNNGEVLFHGIGRDISGQEQLLELLKSSEERYRAIVNSQMEFVDRYLPGGILTFVNDALCRYVGKTPEELFGRSFYPFVHEDDRPALIAALEALTPDNPSVETVNRTVLSDGTVRWNSWNMHAFFDRNGKIIEYQSVGRDITPEREMALALAANEQRYRAIVNSQTEFVDRYLPGGILTFVNDALCCYTGMSREDLLGRTFFDFIAAEDRETLAHTLASRTPEEPSAVTAVQVILPDGRKRWHHWTNTAIFDAHGVISEYQSVGRDITDQKLSALALKKSEEKYRRLHETMVEGFALTDMEGRIMEWNESFRAMLGYSAAELSSLTYRDITPEKWHDTESRLLVNEVMVFGHSRVYEKEYLRKDGNVIPVELRTYLLRDDRGHPLSMWAIIRDISARKQMENALRESEARYRRFIATAHEGIGVADENLVITYANNRLAEMLGYAPDELLGMQVQSIIEGSDQERLEEILADSKAGVSSANEYRVLRKDGSYAWLLNSSTPILDDTDTFRGCFAMFTDLTGRREAEIALQAAHDELEQRVAERTTDLATANEQIKRISFQLVQAEELERARIAAELHDQVGQALLLAKMKLDILASELDSGAIAETATLLENSLNDIRTLTFRMRPPLLESAGIEAALEWLCASLFKDYALRVDFSPSGEPLLFSSETRYSLFQAIRELLLNVAKHAGVDRAELSLRKTAEHLVVRVADSGSGFAESPATMADNGFGLYNVRQRIEQLGGKFMLFSSGDGTNVTLLVPLEKTLPGEGV